MTRELFFALAMSVAGAAAAQDPPARSPADPQAPAASSAYRSAFEGYRPFADPEPIAWRKANQQVGALEGHKGHLQPEADAKGEPPRHDKHAEHHK